jgi:hypothetical protein
MLNQLFHCPCCKSLRIWKGEVTSLFKYWEGSLVENQDRSSKVAQTIPALPNPITKLLRKENLMNPLTSKECVSI